MLCDTLERINRLRKQAMANPEYRSMKEWVGENFEPEHFSVSEVNTMLAELRRE